MNTTTTLLSAFVLSISAGPAWAQSGPLSLPGVATVAGDFSVDTEIQLPVDGLLRYTSFTVRSGVTVTFRKNTDNTPVYLFVDGPVVIDGTIDVSGLDGGPGRPGQGGPGGFDGGAAFYSTSVGPGTGQGPGGSLAGGGHNGFGSDSSSAYGPTYGSHLVAPLIGGSGGAGYYSNHSTLVTSGGGGGGAILVASNQRVSLGSAGQILARGGGAYRASGAAYIYAGSGGAVRVVAPIVDGTGLMAADGGASANSSFVRHGRVRIDTLDLLSLQSLSLPSYTAFGSWMDADPFGRFAVPAQNPTVDIAEVIIDGQSYSPSLTGLTTSLAQSSTMDVVVEYANFPGDFVLEVRLQADFNPTPGRQALPARTVTASVDFNPMPVPSTGCYTDATGSGSCMISIEYYPNVGSRLSALVRSF